jgi:hypothetical protein
LSVGDRPELPHPRHTTELSFAPLLEPQP